MGLVDNIVGAESGGDPNASNPNSSASGPGQFIDSTWLSTIKAHRPDLAQGQSDDALLAMKTDPQLSAEMTGAYAQDNQAILQKNGLPVTDGTTYLAHFAGPGGAVKILQADPNASAADILGPAVLKANPFLKDMTAQGLQAWAAKKMGVASPVANTAPASPASPPSAPPAAIPQAPPPIFPAQQPQPQQAAQQDAQQQAAPFQAPSMMLPPIFYAPRRSPDLSKLRAALGTPVYGKS